MQTEILLQALRVADGLTLKAKEKQEVAKLKLKEHIEYVLSRNYGYGQFEVFEISLSGFSYTAGNLNASNLMKMKGILFASHKWERLHRNAFELDSRQA